MNLLIDHVQESRRMIISQSIVLCSILYSAARLYAHEYMYLAVRNLAANIMIIPDTRLCPPSQYSLSPIWN
jgi:hypothetical protein